jgi:hypothetical protein
MRILLIVATFFSLANSALADSCEIDARVAMLDVNHPVPMRQDVTTAMAGNEIKSAALSTPGRRGMALDANETPTSLGSTGGFTQPAMRERRGRLSASRQMSNWQSRMPTDSNKQTRRQISLATTIST